MGDNSFLGELNEEEGAGEGMDGGVNCSPVV